MLHVDEFESVFRAAAKKLFQRVPRRLERALIVTDLDADDGAAYEAALRVFLGSIPTLAHFERRDAGSFQGVEGVLQLVEDAAPDIVLTYRNLNSDAYRWAYSLGTYLNALTRHTALPVLVTPHPRAFPKHTWQSRGTESVLVITDHLTGDDALVSIGADMTKPGGTLHVAHVEDDAVLARYIDAISKIPELDTSVARETIHEQLLREPREYLESAARALAESGPTLVPHIIEGHSVKDYRATIDAQPVDLLVFPTLEEDRIALSGVAYSLALSVVDTPILMV